MRQWIERRLARSQIRPSQALTMMVIATAVYMVMAVIVIVRADHRVQVMRGEIVEMNTIVKDIADLNFRRALMLAEAAAGYTTSVEARYDSLMQQLDSLIGRLTKKRSDGPDLSGYAASLRAMSAELGLIEREVFQWARSGKPDLAKGVLASERYEFNHLNFQNGVTDAVLAVLRLENGTFQRMAWQFLFFLAVAAGLFLLLVLGWFLTVLSTRRYFEAHLIAETALRESEQKYRALIDTLPQAVLIIQDHVIRFANPAALAMYRLTDSEKIEGRSIDQVVAERERERLRSYGEARWRGESDVPMHYRVIGRRSDGEEFPAEVYVKPFILNGRPASQAVVFDITERHQAEEALRESEERFRNLADLAPVLIWMAGVKRHTFYFNRTWQTFTGRNIGKEYGQGWQQGVHPEDLPRMLAVYDTAFASRSPFTVEYRLMHADGTYHWVLDTGAPRVGAGQEFTGYIGSCVDISARLDAEQAMRDSESRFRSLYNNTPGMLQSVDTKGRIVSVSDFWLETMEYGRNDVIGRAVQDFLTPDSRKRLSDTLLPEFLKTGKLQNQQLQYVTKSGRVLDTLVSMIAERDAGGAILRGLSLVMDVTERIRAEETLRTQAQILDEIHDAVIATDFDAHIISWNKGAERLYGYRPDEVIGKHISALYPDPLILEQEVIKPLLENGVHATEIRLKRKSGEEFDAQIYLSIYLDAQGSVKGFIGYSLDITDRKRAAAELRKTNQRLHDIIEFLPDATVVVDSSRKVVAWNRAIEEMTGVRKEDIIGKGDYAYAKAFYGESRPMLLDLEFEKLPDMESKYDFVRRSGDNIEAEVFVPQLFGGRGAQLWINATLLHDEAGNITGAIESVRDITLRKNTETELRESQRVMATLLSNLPGMAYRCANDADWTMEFVSFGCLDLTGYYSDELIANRRITYEQVVHPEDREAVRRAVEDGVRAKQFYRMVYRIITASGQTKWVWERGQGVFDENGELLFLEGFIGDITDRVEAEKALEQRVHFEHLITSIANRFISVSYEAVDAEIERALGEVGAMVGADLCFVFQMRDNGRVADCTHEWITEGARSLKANMQNVDVRADWPWITERMLAQENVVWSSVDEIPAEAKTDKAYMMEAGIQALVTCPIRFGGQFFGTIGFLRERSAGAWPEDVGMLLRVVGDIVVGTLARKNAEAALYRTNRALRTISDCNQLLVRTDNEAALLRDICRIVVETGGNYFAYVGLSDGVQSEKGEVATFAGHENGYLKDVPVAGQNHPLGYDPGGAALWTGQLSVINNLAAVEHKEPWQTEALKRGYRSAIGLPLAYGGKTFGALGIYSDEANAFGQTETDLLRELADDVAYGLAALRTQNEHRQAVDALARSEARLRSLYDTMSQGIVYQDQSGRIVEANPAAERILGLTLDKMRARTSLDQHWQAIREDGTPFPGEMHPSMVALLTGVSVHSVVMGVFNPRLEQIRWIEVDAVPQFQNGEKTPYQVFTVFSDITDRKRAEEALRQSEDRFRTTFMTSPDAVAIHRLNDGVCVDVNEEYERVFGWNRDEVIGRTLEDLKIWVDPADTEKIHNRLIEKGIAQNVEFKFRAKDGSIRHGLASARVIVLNNVPHVLSAARDIEDLKQAQEKIRESEERYRLLAENASDMISRHDLEGRYLYVSPACRTLLGFEPDELVGCSPFDFQHPDDRAAVVATLQALQRGETAPPVCFRIRTKDGSYKWVESTTRAVTDEHGTIQEITVGSRDISERKAIEDELIRSRLLLEQTLAQCPVPMVLVSMPDTVIRVVNPAALDFLGIADEPLKIGRTLFEIPISFKDHDASGSEGSIENAPLARSLRGESVAGEERRIVRKDGTERWELVTATPIFGAHGEIIAGYLIMIDITERKQAEKALLESEERFRAAFHTSPDCIVIADALTGRIVDMNDGFTRIVGYTAEEIVGKTTLDFDFYVDLRDRERFYHEMHEHSVVDNLPFRFRRKGGEVRDGVYAARLMNLGDQTRMLVTIRDVTEFNRAQKEITDWNRRFEIVVASSGQVVYDYDIKTGQIEWSGSIEKVLGYPRGRNRESFERWKERVHPDDLALALEPPESYAENGGRFELEYRYRHEDGHDLLIRDSGFCIYDEDGNAIRELGMMHDITERKAAEQALREKTEELDRFFGLSLELLCIASLDGRLIRLNPAWEKSLGYSIDEMTGMPFMDFVHPDDRQSTVDAVSVLASEETIWDFTNRYRAKDGSYRWIEWRSVPYQGKLIYAAARDVTERKLAEEARRALEERFRNLFDNMAEGVVLHEVLFDENGRPKNYRILDANPSFERHTGVKRADVVGQLGNEAYGTDDPPYLDSFTTVLHTGRPEFFETYFPPMDKHFAISVVGLGNAGFATIFTDISERVRNERELREANLRRQALFDGARDAIFIADVETGLILDVNQEAVRLTKRTRDELIGLHQTDLHPTEENEEYREFFQQHVMEAKTTLVNAEVLTSDGQRVPVEVSASLIEMAGGKIVIQGIFRDISERKQAERELFRRQARLDSIFRAAPTGIGILCDRKIVDANDTTCRIIGYSREEFIGQTTRFLYLSEEAYEAAGRDMYEQVVKNGEATIELLFKRKDGTVINILSRLAPVDLPEWPGAVTFVITDITALRQTQRALAESERQFRLIAENASDIIWTVDKDLCVTYVSPSAVKRTGIGEKEFFGKRILEFIIPDQRQEFADVLNGILEWDREASPTETRPVEYRTFSPSGNHQWMEATLAPIRDGNGNVVGVQGISRNVTERKRIEVELRERQGRLDSIFRAAPAGIGVVISRILNEVNDTICAMTGYTRDELIGQSARMLYPNDEEFEFVGREKYRQISERGTGTVETKWVCKDGQIIDVLLSSSPIYPEDLSKGVTFTVLDITERKRAEQTLQLNQSRLEVLVQLNQMNDMELKRITDYALEEGVRLTKSQIGYLAFLNEDESVLTMHSWSKGAMAQCSVPDMTYVYPVETTGLWGEAVRQRRPVITNDYSAPHPAKKGTPAGHVPVIRHMNVPIFDGTKIVAVAGVGNKDGDYDDIDVLQLTILIEAMWRMIQRKRADEELARRASELERSNAELERFAYVASHDLQEPLRMMASYAQLLEQRYKGKLDDDADEFIGFITDGAERMRQLIRDLLAFSRVDTRAKPFTKVDCGSALQNVVTDLQVAIEEYQAVVTHDPLPVIIADDTQFSQLLRNLISNAIKFKAKDPPRVHVSAAETDAEWQFTVTDNGIGIDRKYFDQIFVIFKRLHGRAEYPGTGIGLAICKKIVERHGGKIWVDSKPGRGTTFHFTIPKRKSAERRSTGDGN